jgi:hypothetical protein
MTGGVLRKKALFWGGGSIFGGGESSGLGVLDFLVLSWSSAVWEDHYGGTGLLGVLGMGARISIWYPGARKPDRLLLAGREETRFGQSWSVH